MRLWWQYDLECISDGHVPTFQNRGHDSGLAHDRPILLALKQGIHQPRAEPVKLTAGITETGDLNNGAGWKKNLRSARQLQQSNTPRGDVLTNVSGGDPKAASTELIKKLRV